MGIFNIWGGNDGTGSRSAIQLKPKNPRPEEVLFRFLPGGQTLWYSGEGNELLTKGFLDNHVVFTVMDWIGKKIASAPIVLYQVKSERALRKYETMMKNAKGAMPKEAAAWKAKALIEVEDENHEILKLLARPNKMMGWFEFAYGSYIWKATNGSAYWMGTRAGSVNDKTAGKIKELTLLPSIHVGISSGGMMQPVESYHLKTNPDVKIPAANVGQIRNFSPKYDNEIDFLYGLSQLYPARKIIQKYNEGVDAETDLLQKKGIRDIVFNSDLPENSEVDYDSMSKTRDTWNQKINDSGPGSILINTAPLGVIRVGFSPTELGILESQKLTKEDICALLHVQTILFNWNEQTTFNNMSEATKISLIDAVIPELHAIRDMLNTWLLPSYDASGKYYIDFDLDVFPELQEDKKEKATYLNMIPLTSNEIRVAMGWGEDPGENSNEVLVNGNKKRLSDLGLDSFPGDPNETFDDEEEEDKPGK